MDSVETPFSGYCEGSGGEMRAGHQEALFRGGNRYPDSNFLRLDRLIRAQIVR
jgi:peptidyl-prolyl cis-trans isomerase A (cyclophilin A)